MSKCPRCLAALSLLLILTIAASAQTTTISGTVRNSETKEPVPFVTVAIKGTASGTYTNEKGTFKLTTSRALPLTLEFSSVGFTAKEVSVSGGGTPIDVDLTPGSDLGSEVVVSASRVPERILESPVSIERMNIGAIRASAAPSYYDGIANLKGVDLTTSSLTFRTISTRGFNGSGNLRFNQLVDGMDNQAPGLNFSVGNIIGLTELDVDNVELLQGASSALYGSGGMNGTLLMTSKSPFKYEGLSAQVKQGFMHFNDPAQNNATPYYDWSLRYAKKIGERFAFRVSGQFIKADDWQATDYRNLKRENVFSSLKDGNRDSDPNYDGVNVFGDEASASMQAFAQVVRATVGATPQGQAALAGLNQQLSLGMKPTDIATFWQGVNPTFAQALPFLIPTSTVTGGNPYGQTFGAQNVSRTGYNEKDLVDYNTYNVKVSAALHYKLTENTEVILAGNWGTGTTVYTGADRYAIKNLKMGQYKLEFKGKNWFVRGYTIQENSGDAYTATTAAVAINRAWKADATWFQDYAGTYGAAILGLVPGTGGTLFNPTQAHGLARGKADDLRYKEGTPEFKAAFDNAVNLSIKEGGAKFMDATDMYHFEGQYNFSDKIKWAEVLVGASYRLYSLNSSGTIFADTTGTIGISEYGGYAQVAKWLIEDRLKLTVSGRYDKNENFDGRFTPRATALIKVAKDNSFRLSYQQAYRFPSTQDQWINLKTPASVLIGGMPDFYTFYKFDQSPAYTAESIVAYRNSIASGAPNPTLLKAADFGTLKPEIANSYEVGYRGLLTSSLLVDAYGYYSRYQDFLGRKAVGRGASADPAKAFTELASPFTTSNYSFISNSDDIVKAIGWGVSVNYRFNKGYDFGVNVSGDQLQDVPDTLVTFFNTPKVRFNVTFGNEKVNGSNWGFNILYRWQDKMVWEGTFGTGNVDAFGSLDAQISYRLPKIKSLIKLGATNLTNTYYTTAFGNPSVGGLYYVSFGYNVF